MKKSKLLQKTIIKLVEASVKDGKIVESQVTKAIKVLKTLPQYQAIQALTEYLKALKREERKYTMFVEAAIPLSADVLKKMKKIIEKKTNPSITLRVSGEQSRTTKITKVIPSVNSEILGGFKLRIGDQIWDESLLGKITQIKEAIISGRSN